MSVQAAVSKGVQKVSDLVQASVNGSNPSNVSNLSKFDYDFVVATTQASINATMMAFLSGLKEPVVTVCYVASDQEENLGDPVVLDYDTLKHRANGSDPFAIPEHVDKSNADVSNLKSARFMMGFRARLGLPPGQVHDIVTLGSDTSSVLFNMYCSEFTVVELKVGFEVSWMKRSQQSSNPWIFTSKVDMRLSTVDENAYSSLPTEVQRKIQNLGEMAFSVQQLLFDLSNAALMTVPTISGVNPGTPLYTILQQYFIGAYFTEMQKKHQPLLACSIVREDSPDSSLHLTSLNFNVCPYLDRKGQRISKPTVFQKELATLNYLCATDGNVLPPPSTFTWNWVDESQGSDIHGVISINRNTLAKYIRKQIESGPFNVKSYCVTPTAGATLSGIFNTDILFTAEFKDGQLPVVTMPETGPTVLSFDYSDASFADPGGIGDLNLKCTYSLKVDFLGDKIVVTQHQIFHVDLRVFPTSESGNVIDRTLVDIYTIGIDAEGKFVVQLESEPKDNSYFPTVGGIKNWFSHIDGVKACITNSAKKVSPTGLSDLPLSIFQDFVFPGGKTFMFKSVRFSEFQDLVSFITYADPTAPATVPTNKPSSNAPSARVSQHRTFQDI